MNFSQNSRAAGPKKPQRRSIRLKGYDYSGIGSYFITICTHDRMCLFGEVMEGLMVLNEPGRIVERCWKEIPGHFPHVELDQFVVMPNHVHGILAIKETFVPVGAKNILPSQRARGTSKTIGSVVRGFKIGVTKWIRQQNLIKDVWQRNYHEHIIRNEDDLNSIREYIMENPRLWAEDSLNPANAGAKKFSPREGQ